MARKDPLDKLSLRHTLALGSFYDTVEELESVAANLGDIATEADRAADAALSRAAAARVQATDAQRRATAVRDLLGL